MIDIVLLGATGYTGRLCTSYMAQVLPGNVSWAIAGRSKSKLQALHRELQLEEPKCRVVRPRVISRLLKAYRYYVRS